MIPISAEVPASPEAVVPAPGGRPGAGGRQFLRALVGVIAVLAIACAALVVVAQLRGPRLTETSVDTSAVTLRAGQQARVFFSGSVAHVRAAQVSVTPAAPFTVQTSGTIVTVQFTGRLNSATPYSIRLDGVTSLFGSRAATVTSRFTTAHASVLVLDRAATAGGVDRIVAASVNAVGRTVRYQARGIQTFAPIADDLVVVAQTGRLSTIRLVSSDGTTENLLLPGPGLVTSFSLDAPTGVLVYGFVPQGSTSAPRLYTITLTGTHASALYKGSTLPAGDATAGTRGARLSPAGTAVTVGATTLYSAPSGARLSALASSPNGQFVTVVSAPAGTRSDGATIAPAPVGATLLVIDRASGAVVASFAGSAAVWA